MMDGNPRLLGLATASPQTSDQAALASLAVERCCQTPQQRRLLPTLYRRARVERRGSILMAPQNQPDPELEPLFPRAEGPDDAGPTTAARMALYARFAGPLALQAARPALDASGLPPQRVTHLVTVSCTGFTAPGVDIELIHGLGLSGHVERTHIGFMGCHGAINGLRAARAFAVADPQAVVLLVAVELCTLHFQYAWDPQQMVANALFADGAAAVVLAGHAVDAPASTSANADHDDGDVEPLRLAASASRLIPDSTDAMTWLIGEHGFQMTLSPRAPDLIAGCLGDVMTGWLQREGLSPADIGSWAIHPGGPRIVEAAGEALGLPASVTEVSGRILRDHGNMSSPTVLFLLEALLREGQPRPVVMLAFGPGLMAEAVLWR